jgi:hypothetical protein
LVNTTVAVPRFHPLPKGFEDVNLDAIILSQQRVDLLRELHAQVTDGKIDAAGFVFSGPQGIGKSVEMYLFASYLYINKHPLVYIPLCSVWRDKPYAHLVQQFHFFNHDQLTRFVDDGLRSRIATYFESTEDAVRKVPDLWSEIETQMTGNPLRLCLLFDEHNELFREPRRISDGCVPLLSILRL